MSFRQAHKMFSSIFALVVATAVALTMRGWLSEGTSSLSYQLEWSTAKFFAGQRSVQDNESLLSSISVPSYEALIYSRDPLMIYIKNFVSRDEIDHILEISKDMYEPTMVYPGDDAYLDLSQRVSESADVPRTEIVRRIEKRARRFQGWRGKNTRLQPLRVQRYGVNGFYTFHYDWDRLVEDGNRVTTFTVYLKGNCTGGGTNFPRLARPTDNRWCDVVDCDDDEYPGVTFKPLEGAAVFWENMHPNGSFHKGVRHAGLPVKSGEKIGLNIWSWDSDWRLPVEP